MYLWNRLKKTMASHSDAEYADDEERISFGKLLQRVAKEGGVLADGYPNVKICVIDRKRYFDTGISVLVCLSQGIIPIVVSNHYGREKRDRILTYIDPDLLITDWGVVEWNRERHDQSDLEEVELIMCTSGTSSGEKGAMFTGKSIYKNVMGIQAYYGLREQDCVLIARPLSHCGVLIGEFFLALYVGASIFFYDEKFSPAGIVKIIENQGIDSLGMTPTLCSYVEKYYSQRKKVSSLKKMTLSGECFQESLARRINKTFPLTQIFHVYGLTEAGPRVSYLPPELFCQDASSSGYPLQGTSIKIMAPVWDHGRQVGEIYVKSDSLMLGYYGIHDNGIKDGWLATGDLGYIKEGRITVVSRKDHMIIKAGINIFPAEVESQLNEIDGIKESYVFGIRSEAGEELAAQIVLENQNMGSKELYKKVAARLPSYFFPKQLEIVNFLPKTESGKIIRRKK